MNYKRLFEGQLLAASSRADLRALEKLAGVPAQEEESLFSNLEALFAATFKIKDEEPEEVLELDKSNVLFHPPYVDTQPLQALKTTNTRIKDMELYDSLKELLNEDPLGLNELDDDDFL